MSYGEFLYDKRIVRRTLEKGLITTEDQQKRLANLPNLEGRFELVSFENDEATSEGEERSAAQAEPSA